MIQWFLKIVVIILDLNYSPLQIVDFPVRRIAKFFVYSYNLKRKLSISALI
jgi:hypothetical protein